MQDSFIKKLFEKHLECTQCPPTQDVVSFFQGLMGLLFPPFSDEPIKTQDDLIHKANTLKADLKKILYQNVTDHNEEEIAEKFFEELPAVYKLISLDITAMYMGDPAAHSHDEIIRAYPGFYAISAYRIAHNLVGHNVHTVPRMITEHAHSITGIDIHPNATIGSYFCIDHGTGVVIGETTQIGNHVKIYQGVTLGALSVSKEDATLKRHPTICDHVVLYAGATILGGNTTIGAHSIIGGNVWLTQSVPENSKIYYKASMSNNSEGTSDMVIIK